MNEQEWLTTSHPEYLLKFLDNLPSDRKMRLFACACVSEIDSALLDHRLRLALTQSERYADGSLTDSEFEIVVAESEEVAIQNFNERAEAELAEEQAEKVLEAAAATVKQAEDFYEEASQHKQPWKEGHKAEKLLEEARAEEDFAQTEFDEAKVKADEARIASASAAVVVSALTRDWQAVVEQVVVISSELQSHTDDDVRRWISHLFRDIIGNPFRCTETGINDQWRQQNTDIIETAGFIYECLSTGDATEYQHTLSENGLSLDELWDTFCGMLCESGIASDDPLVHHLTKEGPHVKGCWAIDAILCKEAVTNEQWESCNDPMQLLQYLWSNSRHRLSERRLRLFALACCGRIRDILSAEYGSQVVQIAERFIEGKDVEHDRERFREKAPDEPRGDEYYLWSIVDDRAAEAATTVAWYTRQRRIIEAAYQSNANEDVVNKEEKAFQCSFLRDIFGPLTANDSSREDAWRTPAVVSLGQSIYEGRSFFRMPELGQMLEACGCKDAAILDHCRCAGEHVRGCWVIDRVIGTE